MRMTSSGMVHSILTCLMLCVHTLVTSSISLVSHNTNPVTRTKYGSLKGIRVTEEYVLGHAKVTDAVDKYLGIPYAKPPVGRLRFRPPESPYPWGHTRDATEHGSVCPQVIFHPRTGSAYQDEDCLYLDVYVPYKEEYPELKYPVMVFVHGGSFEVGSGKLYDGTVLAQLGVVVVTINYRLGALGFMSAGTDDLSGNLGLMDQVQSLRWVNQNIANFHGDENKVTVFGHSAGGASVGLLLVLPQARGLVHGVIAQSGSAVASYSVHDDETDFRAYVADVGVLYDCHQAAVAEILDCLREVPASRFIEKRMEFPLYDPIDPEFRPYLDGTWLTDYPTRLFQTGNFNRIPVMTGTVHNEFANYFNGGVRHRPAFDEALDRYVGSYAINNDIMNVVKFEYTNWFGTSSEEYDRGSVLSDMHMVAPTVQFADVLSQHSDDVYQYYFTIDDCFHSVELNYVFGAPFSGRLADEMSVHKLPDFSREDKAFSLQIMSLWTNFAKHGNPTPLGSPGTPTWKPFNPVNKWYMRLNPEEMTMEQKLRQDKVVFWNSVIPQLRTHFLATQYKVSGSAVPEPGNYGVNLWVFLAIVTVLFILVLSLAVLFTRSSAENERIKRTLCVEANGQTKV